MKKKKESRKRETEERCVERRKNARARTASHRGARKRCAMPRERESRRKHRREFRYSRRTAAAVVASRRVCATSESMRVHMCARARVLCARACVCVCVLRGGSAVRERNSLPEPRYLEESPFLLIAVVIIHSSFRRFARDANVCVSRCDRSRGRGVERERNTSIYGEWSIRDPLPEFRGWTRIYPIGCRFPRSLVPRIEDTS